MLVFNSHCRLSYRKSAVIWVTQTLNLILLYVHGGGWTAGNKGAGGLAKELGLAKAGDLVVITGGVPIGVAGVTNLLKVERVS